MDLIKSLIRGRCLQCLHCSRSNNHGACTMIRTCFVNECRWGLSFVLALTLPLSNLCLQCLLSEAVAGTASAAFLFLVQGYVCGSEVRLTGEGA